LSVCHSAYLQSTSINDVINYRVIYLNFTINNLYDGDFQWRWRVFAGEWQTHELNERWWQLRLTIQGVSPPIRRSEADFDPAAKRHVATHKPYIGYAPLLYVACKDPQYTYRLI
jgi:hypothetical protein